jgi:hypothetical protein
MYTLFRLLPWRHLLAQQLPVLLAAWLVAETFYKFRSFTLECAAFLVTWFVFDFVVQTVRRTLGPTATPPPTAGH